MAVSKKIIELEGQRGILQILLALQQHGELLYGLLYNNKSLVEISNNSTAKRALELLLKHGLIHQQEYEGRRAIYYRLTPKGEQCASLVTKIEEILEEKSSRLVKEK
jgi:DNA-binding HxlR family transcriptional regulator